MAGYQRHNWIARVGVGLNKWRNIITGALLELENEPDRVDVDGTPVSVQWLNEMEEGIIGNENLGVQNALDVLDIKSEIDFEYDFLPNNGRSGVIESFKNTDEIDLPNTTATVNTTDRKVTFADSQVLEMKQQTFEEDFTRVALNIHGDYQKATVIAVTDSTNIETVGSYNLKPGDNLVINNEEVAITSASPGQVETIYASSQGSLTKSSTGKTIVEFNGDLHEVVFSGTTATIRRLNKDNSSTIVISFGGGLTNIASMCTAIVDGNEYLYILTSNGSSTFLRGFDTSYSALFGASLIINGATQSLVDICNFNNKLHIISIVSSSIQSREVTIASDGTFTFDYSNFVGETVTTGVYGFCNYNNGVPTIAVREIISSTQDHIRIHRRVNSAWTSSTLATGVEYTNPVLIEKRSGSNINRAFIAYAFENGAGLITRYSDNGFASNALISTGAPTIAGDSTMAISEDGDGNVDIIYDRGSAPGIDYVRLPDGTLAFDAPVQLQSTGTNPTSSGANTNYDVPIVMGTVGAGILVTGVVTRGSGQEIELATPQTLTVGDELPISTQYIVSTDGTDTMDFAGVTEDYISYATTLATARNTTNVQITGKDTEVDRFYYAII